MRSDVTGWPGTGICMYNRQNLSCVCPISSIPWLFQKSECVHTRLNNFWSAVMSQAPFLDFSCCCAYSESLEVHVTLALLCPPILLRTPRNWSVPGIDRTLLPSPKLPLPRSRPLSTCTGSSFLCKSVEKQPSRERSTTSVQAENVNEVEIKIHSYMPQCQLMHCMLLAAPYQGGRC